MADRPGDVSTPPVPPPPSRGVRAVTGETFSFADAIGGVRGLVESALPALVFVVVFLGTRDLTPALVAAIGVAVVAVVVRLVQRTPPTQAFSGLLGVAIAALWAWRTGEAQDFFAYGLWVNVAWFAGALLSIVVGRPAVGLIVGLLRPAGAPGPDDGAGAATATDGASTAAGTSRSDRTDGSDGSDGLNRSDAVVAAAMARRYLWATWVWVGVFGLRLAVQVPLYLQGADAVGWLGTAKLAMGLPLFGLGLWLTWLLVGPRAERSVRRGPPPTPPR